MWDTLKGIHSDSSALNKQGTLSAFLTYEVKSGQSLVEAYTEIEKLSRSLNEMGATNDETTTVTKIVSSLPNVHKAFKKAWDSVPAASQTIPMLLSRLKKEDLEKKLSTSQKDSVDEVQAFQSQSKPDQADRNSKQDKIKALKKKTNCKKCVKMGHWPKECRSKPNRSNLSFQGSESQATAFAAYPPQSDEEVVFYSDSGASKHVCGTTELFSEFQEFNIPEPVGITDRHDVFALGKGTVVVEAKMGRTWKTVRIENTLYIPGAVNLFSEVVMSQKGYLISRDAMKTVL